MTINLVLKNCKIVKADGILEGNIAVENGKIADIKIAGLPEADEIIDCKGKIVLPGMVDAHVHFREPGLTYKEDFSTGSMSAAFGGVTTILDMPNNKPFIDTQKKFEYKSKLVKNKSYVDYGFHFGVSSENLEEIKKVNAFGYKVYLSDRERITYEDMQKALSMVNGKVFSVHPEDPDLAKGINRPIEAETTAISKVLEMNFYGNSVNFVHSTCMEAVDLVRASSKSVTNMVDVPHLFLNSTHIEKIGAYAKMQPPLRSPQKVNELWENLDKIDSIGTDHAPHTIEEKEQEFEIAPPGIPGVETALPLLMNAAYHNRISWEQIVKLYATKPAEIYKIKGKGSIEIGNDADFVIVDRKREWTIKAEYLHSKCGWTPYENWTVRGFVEKVFLRGNPIVDQENLIGKKGLGREMINEKSNNSM